MSPHPHHPHDRRTDLHILRLMALAAGIGVFVYTIRRFGGFDKVLAHIIQLPPSCYALVAVNSCGWTLLYTQAWRYLLSEKLHLIRFRSLFKVKVCGEAVNLMTPAGFVVGDPVRVLLLKKYVGLHARMRSVVVDRALHSLSAQAFCFIALMVLFTQDVPFPLWIHLVLIGLYAGIMTVVVSVIVSMIHGRGLGVFEPVFRLINIPKRFPELNAKLEELRAELHFYASHPKRPFFIAFCLHFLGRALGAVEFGIMVYYFTGEPLFGYSIILTALVSFVSVAGGVIPGALGLLEALSAGFTGLYGLPPAMGITIQLVRRIRVLFWIAVGVLVMDYGEIGGYVRRRRLVRRAGKDAGEETGLTDERRLH